MSSCRISSCICAFYLTVLAAGPAAGGGARLQSAAEDPDALYGQRAHLASAGRAAEIWAAAVQQSPTNFEAAWKLARVHYWLGGHEREDRQKQQYERGIDAARLAVKADPNRPEGHFWLAANMGALAESFGLRQGLRYRGAIRDALERVLKIDPGFQLGSADRALGRWYHKVPGLFGGSDRKAEEHLRKALSYDADSTVTRYFLAEVLVDLNRREEAKAELRKVLSSPGTPGWEPEDGEWRSKAAQLLDELERS